MLNIKPNKKIALMLAKRSLPELVCDAVNLEGINFTLPEVQTLLDGITVGGHKLHDQEITLNQSKTWKKIFVDVESDKFQLTKDYIISLHELAGKNEALEWGCFRSGGVTIAGTDYIPPKAKELDESFEIMIEQSSKIKDIYEQSIFIFLEMARYQFFYDVNKRMGRFIMNGNLLRYGYPVINVPAKRQLEFNQKMLNFYESHNHKEMTEFMLSCIDKKVIEIMSE
ncbi:Fic family protein [Francisella philomiragia]|uniref:Fic family protein n=1 Tax=Francisella philomiragia TaxID=28110 RepID=UPI001908D81B|nr:Fic family protein [Francisella philomiragia]MBK2270208.1 Fic family protein [Francisella philomiragia]MBK2275872.1 Fic family protein [Francisella philomiragia]MBK2305085.1 Fic family protein [Francisella philomiragia]